VVSLQTASTFGAACVGCESIRSETEGQRSTGRSEHHPIEGPPRVAGAPSVGSFEEEFSCPAPGVGVGVGPSNHRIVAYVRAFRFGLEYSNPRYHQQFDEFRMVARVDDVYLEPLRYHPFLTSLSNNPATGSTVMRWASFSGSPSTILL